MIKTKLIGITLLVIMLTSVCGTLSVIPRASAADTTSYSPALIGELGEASTVLIYSQIDANIRIPIPDDDGVPTGDYISVPVSTNAMGSGSFVSSTGYILTAGHVVFSFTHTEITQDLYTKYFLIDTAFSVVLQALEDDGVVVTPAEQADLQAYIDTYGVLQDSFRQVYAILGEVKPTLTDIQAKGWVARVVKVSPYAERDLALLKIESLSNCPVLTVGDSDLMMTGDNIYMFGFPGVVTMHPQLGPETTLAPSMTSGIISADRFTNTQTPCFQTDAAITHGNSGGAGLNTKGEIIGVCSRGSITETGQEVAGFDFLIKGNVAKSFITEAGVDNSKGAVDEAFVRGLNYYYDKHYSQAKTEFETVTGLFDYHWRAKALISQCNNAIANGQDIPVQGDFTMLIIIGVVVAIVVVVVAVVFMTRRKKKQPLHAAPQYYAPPPPPNP
jgi:serine protease Do